MRTLYHARNVSAHAYFVLSTQCGSLCVEHGFAASAWSCVLLCLKILAVLRLNLQVWEHWSWHCLHTEAKLPHPVFSFLAQRRTLVLCCGTACRSTASCWNWLGTIQHPAFCSSASCTARMRRSACCWIR